MPTPKRGYFIGDVNAAGDCYVIQGREYPRVTAVLEAAGLVDFKSVPETVLEQAQWRGSAVHNACLFDDQGDLDESTVLPEHRGYLEAWRRAKRDLGFEIEQAEEIERGYDPLPFVGRPDRVGHTLVGRRILDLKTGPIQTSVKWQLAGYGHLKHVMGRLAVRLMGDGRYSVFEFPPSDFVRDLAVFRAALQLWWARKEHNLL